MRLQPVKCQAAPAYPTRSMLDADATLLRQVPKRWQTNLAVLGTLAGLGLLAAPNLLSGAAGQVESPVVARIAPVFPQATVNRAMLKGDVAVPKFLTEEEARQIIMEEADKAGISFTPDVQVIKNVPVTSCKGDAVDGLAPRDNVKIDLTLDGTDTKRHIAYEVITETDIEAWRKQGVNIPGDLPAAVALHDGITQGVPAGTYAVFYDPATAPCGNEDLRQQVRDFMYAGHAPVLGGGSPLRYRES